VAELLEARSDEPGAFGIRFAGGIDGRDAGELLDEVDNFIGYGVDAIDDGLFRCARDVHELRGSITQCLASSEGVWLDSVLAPWRLRFFVEASRIPALTCGVIEIRIYLCVSPRGGRGADRQWLRARRALRWRLRRWR